MSDLITDEFPPADAWEAFREMRRKSKKAMTPYAEKLMLKRLSSLVARGQDAEAVLEQSIRKNWLDIYEVKPEAPLIQPTAPAKLRVVPNPNWWLSDGGIIAKGRELDMMPRPGESYGQFKDRIFAALDRINCARGGA